MKRKIQIKDYVFFLEVSDEDYPVVLSLKFNMRGRLPADLSEEEAKIGQQMTQEIFAGKWGWLIEKEKSITLSTHNIVITVTDVIYDGSIKYGGGTIQSSLKEICEHCNDSRCDFDCPDAQEWASDRDVDECNNKLDELASNRSYNYACNGIEAMVLGHAIAGEDIESASYLEGLETGIDAICNNV